MVSWSQKVYIASNGRKADGLFNRSIRIYITTMAGFPINGMDDNKAYNACTIFFDHGKHMFARLL